MLLYTLISKVLLEKELRDISISLLSARGLCEDHMDKFIGAGPQILLQVFLADVQ